MKETSKSYWVRECLGDFKKYLHGSGVDIGCGDDPLKTPSQQVRHWDLPDGDAVFMDGVPDNHFDFVFASHCLEHLKNVPLALENWLRIVKPYGYVYFVVPDFKLYEKRRWPSTYSWDHWASFSLDVTRKTAGRDNHYHIYYDILPLVFAKAKIIETRLEDDNFDYSLSDDVDQTLGNALCQICVVMQKISF